ncbi:MAG: flagellar filament capping protein FliD [Novosphingobium sp.]|nr:flagellar filament capping protein FliD [Novosphingobium sp.]
MLAPTTTSGLTTTAAVADSASVGSALATALGGGTGIDMTALAGNLATAQFAGRLARIDNQNNRLSTQISQATQLKSDLLTLANSVGGAVRTGALSAQPSVANSAVASATLPAGSAGVSGSYSLEVLTLASPQVLNSPPFAAATTPTGSGSLTINFGTIAGTTFAADAAHAPVTVAIAAGATLADVASAINSSGAGITAYVATSGDGAHLVLKGQQGAANGFTISADETAGDPGLAKLAFDPAAAAAAVAAGTPTATIAAIANDAHFKLDGVDRTATSNTVPNAAPGLSLSLTGTNTGTPTQITFSDPTSQIASSMQELTNALNTLVGEVNTNLDPASGGLSADTGARALRRQLATLAGAKIMPNAAAGAPATLSDLGLSVNKDGTFKLDGARLNATIKANPQAVAAMFTTGLYGVYGTLDSMARNLTSASDSGSLSGSIVRYTGLQTRLGTERAKLATKQDNLRTRLVSQFAHSNSVVSGSRSTLSFLQNQATASANRSN